MTNVTHNFLSMYLFLFLTLYVFQAHRAHRQERKIVSIQPLIAVAVSYACRKFYFRPARDTATNTEWQLPEFVLTQFVSPDDEHDTLETCLFVCFWHNSPQWARASSFTRFLDHTQRRTTIGRTPLDEWSARRRDLYLTTHNCHNRQTSMPTVGFEPAISAGERPQTYALDRARPLGPALETCKEL